MRRILLLLACVILGAPSCIPLTIGALVPSVGGGPRASSGDVSGMPSSGMPSGSGVQHAKPADRSIGEALGMAAQEVTQECLSQLPESEKVRDDAPRCGLRPMCLPGALMPKQMYVCERSS
jgi:hypothetical protein